MKDEMMMMVRIRMKDEMMMMVRIRMKEEMMMMVRIRMKDEMTSYQLLYLQQHYEKHSYHIQSKLLSCPLMPRPLSAIAMPTPHPLSIIVTPTHTTPSPMSVLVYLSQHSRLSPCQQTN